MYFEQESDEKLRESGRRINEPTAGSQPGQWESSLDVSPATNSEWGCLIVSSGSLDSKSPIMGMWQARCLVLSSFATATNNAMTVSPYHLVATGRAILEGKLIITHSDNLSYQVSTISNDGSYFSNHLISSLVYLIALLN